MCALGTSKLVGPGFDENGDLFRSTLDEFSRSACVFTFEGVRAGSRLRELVCHRDRFDEGKRLTRGRSIVAGSNKREAVEIRRLPGQFCLLPGQTFSGCYPNQSHHRQVGISMSGVTPVMGNREGIKLVAPTDARSRSLGSFCLVQPSQGLMRPRNVALLRESTLTAETFYHAVIQRWLHIDAIGLMAQSEGIQT